MQACFTVRSVDHGEQLPPPGHAPELMLTAIVEDDSRADDQVGHGSRHPDLTRLHAGFNPCHDVDADAGDVVTPAFDLAGVYPDAHVEAELVRAVAPRRSRIESRAGPSNVARMPSPVDLTRRPPNR